MRSGIKLCKNDSCVYYGSLCFGRLQFLKRIMVVHISLCREMRVPVAFVVCMFVIQ